MPYEKFAINFTIIDQIVYEIITNQFTPIPAVAPLTHFCASLFKLFITHRFYKFLFTITFFLLILKICLPKKNCLYICREKEYSRKKSINEFV